MRRIILDRPVIQTTPEGKVISIFTDVRKVADEIGTHQETLMKCIEFYDIADEQEIHLPALVFPTGNFRFVYEDKAHMHEQINCTYAIVEPDPIELVDMTELIEEQ